MFGGGYLFVACLSRMTVDHASHARRCAFLLECEISSPCVLLSGEKCEISSRKIHLAGAFADDEFDDMYRGRRQVRSAKSASGDPAMAVAGRLAMLNKVLSTLVRVLLQVNDARKRLTAVSFFILVLRTC